METSFLFKVRHELTVFYIFQAQDVILDIQDTFPTAQQSQVIFITSKEYFEETHGNFFISVQSQS